MVHTSLIHGALTGAQSKEGASLDGATLPVQTRVEVSHWFGPNDGTNPFYDRTAPYNERLSRGEKHLRELISRIGADADVGRDLQRLTYLRGLLVGLTELKQFGASRLQQIDALDTLAERDPTTVQARRDACARLAQSTEPVILSALVQTIRLDDLTVAISAAKALRDVEDPKTRAALKELAARCAHTLPEFQIALRESLGEITNTAAGLELCSLIFSGRSGNNEIAELALQPITSEQVLVKLAKHIQHNVVGEYRATAARILAQTATPMAHSYLVAACCDDFADRSNALDPLASTTNFQLLHTDLLWQQINSHNSTISYNAINTARFTNRADILNRVADFVLVEDDPVRSPIAKKVLANHFVFHQGPIGAELERRIARDGLFSRSEARVTAASEILRSIGSDQRETVSLLLRASVAKHITEKNRSNIYAALEKAALTPRGCRILIEAATPKMLSFRGTERKAALAFFAVTTNRQLQEMLRERGLVPK